MKTYKHKYCIYQGQSFCDYMLIIPSPVVCLKCLCRVDPDNFAKNDNNPYVKQLSLFD